MARQSVGSTARRAASAAGLSLALSLALNFAFASSASASLGGSADSVKLDAARLGARSASGAAADYTVSTLTLANSGVVREFSGEGGVVFAVAWRGPGRPDLRQLLGTYFDRLQAGRPGRLARPGRMPLGMSRSDFILHTGGHPGAFWGVAYLPQLLPADVPRSIFR